MSTKETCKRCGSEVQNDTAGGLCPRCLMALNFESRTMPEGERPDLEVSLSAEDMWEHFPQFEILECLGRGGMGVVYKARQLALDRMVAIKVLAGERQGDVGFARRFEREAKLLAQMSHPNIVTVHDFGEADGLYYIVMEYVDGVNLRDLLQDGTMDPKQALAIVPPVCEALEYAHDKGVVHRDIKPENLLLDREGRLKIADFGIASLVGASGEKSGTPPYMAPEQEQGIVDRRADIYALGAVLYEMLTGERPGQPIEPPSRKIMIDVRLDEIVLRALEKEPARRYQTANEFRTVVETVATMPPVPASTSQAHPKGLWRALKAGKPEAEWEGRAPGWRIRCRSCGFIEHFGKYGIRMAAAGTKWTLGRCQRCHRIRIHVIETGPVPVEQTPPAPTTSPSHAARFSRTAIVGAVWASFFVFVAFLGFSHALSLETSAFLAILLRIQAFTMLPLGLTAPFGTTILGCVALTQIRRSAGKLYGLGLALFDALLFPLLALDVGIWLSVGNLWRANPPEVSHPVGAFLAENEFLIPLFALTLCAVVDLIIVLLAWRAVIGLQIPEGISPTTSPSWQRRAEFGLIIGLIVAAGIGLVSQLRSIVARPSPVGSDLVKEAPTRVDTTPEQAARDYLEAVYCGDVERAQGMIGGPLAETPKETAKYIQLHQVVGTEGARPPELVEWHKEGPYAATSFDFSPKIQAKAFMVLERSDVAWKVVGTGITRPDRSPEDDLGTFKRFRSVNREDRNEVARAFVLAVRQGDSELAAMLAGRPMHLDPSEMAREFFKASRGGPGTGPGIPLRWYEEAPYAVTHVAFIADQPELVSYLTLKQNEGIWRVVWGDITGAGASLADDLKRFKNEVMAARVMVEDLAMRFLVAIREKDEKTLRELCVDRTEGWTESLVGQFSMEVRERFRQQTGEEFTLYPDPTQVRVDKELAVVICRAFRDVQKKLGGNILVLHFCRTESGWKVWSVRSSPESQPIDKHLEQARQWAAAWDDTGATADGNDEAQNMLEQVAGAFMEAVRIRDYRQAKALSARPLDKKEFDILASLMSTLYGADPDRMSEFVEFHGKGSYAVARISSPPGKLDLKPSLALKRSEKTWRILAGPFPSAAGTSSAEELERIRAEFQRDESGDSGAAIEVGKGESVVRSVQLPDADTAQGPKVLDLASGKLLDVPVKSARSSIRLRGARSDGPLSRDAPSKSWRKNSQSTEGRFMPHAAA